eukprot:XP_024451789.1 probable WRKY transcription factor 35 isoform X2 [Populus trichocarpa]
MKGHLLISGLGGNMGKSLLKDLLIQADILEVESEFPPLDPLDFVGYYRCSTSKGCSAKKQVERCRTDASVLIITYTSNHNHPGPDLHESSLNQQSKDPETPPTDHVDHPTTPKQEKPEEETEEGHGHPIVPSADENASEGNSFHYLQSPIRISQDIMISQEDPFAENPEKSHDTLGIVLDEEPISCSRLMTFSAPKSEENNDFFDELEELPHIFVFH